MPITKRCEPGLVAIDSHREVEQECEHAESEEAEEERRRWHLTDYLTREDCHQQR